MIAYTNCTAFDILLHLYHWYGTITPAMQDQATAKMSQPFNPALPMDDLSKQIDDGTMLMDAANTQFTKNQQVTKAFSLIFVTGVHNGACKKWRRKAPTNDTWINFCTHFTNAHEEFMELPGKAQQVGYTANTAENNVQEQTAEALLQLYAATEEDRSTMSNHTTTNTHTYRTRSSNLHI
eukprot:15365343-Ditylum_brightwellii.AAC.1